MRRLVLLLSILFLVPFVVAENWTQAEHLYGIHNFTAYGGAYWNSSENAYYFDGTDDVLGQNDTTQDLNFSGSYAISLEFKLTDPNMQSDKSLTEKWNGPNGDAYAWALRLNNGSTSRSLAFNVYNGSSGCNPNLGSWTFTKGSSDELSWHTVVAMLNRTTGNGSLWIDGRQVGSAINTCTINATLDKARFITIGGRSTSAGTSQKFTGAIRNFRAFNRTLATTEILRLNQSKSAACTASVAWWAMNPTRQTCMEVDPIISGGIFAPANGGSLAADSSFFASFNGVLLDMATTIPTTPTPDINLTFGPPSVTTLRIGSCSPQYENATAQPQGQNATYGIDYVCNNGTAAGTACVKLAATLNANWTLYASNTSVTTNLIRLNTTCQNLVSLAPAACSYVWLKANCSYVRQGPGTYEDYGVN